MLWKRGEIVRLGTFDGGHEAIANAVNNSGQAVGPALNTIPDEFSLLGLGTQTRAFLWEKGVMRDLGTLGGPDAFALYVNEPGQIAGFSYTNSTPNSATGVPTIDPFLWEGGRMLDLGLSGAPWVLRTLSMTEGRLPVLRISRATRSSIPFSQVEEF